MAAGRRREVVFQAKDGFKEKFDVLRANHPEIVKRMTDFNFAKKAKPPKRLPDEMNDHVLTGRLRGIRECHLSFADTNAVPGQKTQRSVNADVDSAAAPSRPLR